ncbi:MAG: hypothetical protein QOK17_1020 [Sphingomonadales bacterium]|jgi:uncharacterized membrane protein|nr:hypothetical protein [Sphingomonadales bacterium]
MTKKVLLTLSLLLAVGMAVLGAAVASRAPAGLQLPVHWNIAGEADRYASKWTALMTAPGMTLLLAAFFWFLPALEPRERNLERSEGLYLSAWAALLIVMVAVEAVMLSAALHWGLRVYGIMTGAVGLTFVLIGNQLGKSRRMYLVGIRTPWTLASEEVWIKTHRLGGKLMVVGGLLLILTAFAPIPSGLRATLFAGGIAVMVGVPIVYSYWLWRREKGAAQASE